MLQVSHVSKAYGAQVVLDDVSFTMGQGERLGLVGRNGHGKTTLLRLILGQESLDDGTITTPKGYRIGHLSQQLEFHRDSVLHEVESVLDHADAWKAEATLMGLGFTRQDLDLPASRFSGGFQIRVELARVLVTEPDLLLLDEPTNYLDIVSMRWLAKTLRGWPGELILVTHDRSFMDSVTTHTMSVHRRKLRRMPGTVDKLLGQIAEEEAIHESTILNEQKKRRSEERFIERFRSKASKASLVQSRIKALERRGPLQSLEIQRDLSFHFATAPFHTSTMLTVEGLRFGYDQGPTLIDGLDLTLDHGDRLAIIGPNGRGKTTLLRLLAGELTPTGGSMRLHPKAAMAHFGQTNVQRLHPDMTVEQELLATDPDKSRSAIRGLAGLLMFSGDAAEKPVSVLSGGEKSRVLLGKLLLQPANLLLLDEPTNHLDMESVEGLLDAVDAFPGAVVMVTHSELILERLATRLVVFDRGRVVRFEGGYRDFLDRVGWGDEDDTSGRQVPAPASGAGDGAGGGRSASGADGGASGPGAGTSRPTKARPAGKDLRRLRAELVRERSKATAGLRKTVETLESRISKLEAEVAEHDQQVAWAAADGRNADLREHAAGAKRKRDAIDAAFDELERATEELDAASASFDARLAELE